MSEVKTHKILRELIQRSGVSVRETARILKIPQSTLSAYLSPRAAFKPEHLRTIAKHFGTSVDYLLFGESSNPASLESLLTESVFNGYLKVKIERVIPVVGEKLEKLK